MFTIYKYPLAVDTVQEVFIHKGATIIHADSQGTDELPVIWAAVNTESPLEKRTIHIYGTGHTIPDNVARSLKHIGTILVNNKTLVFHIFEELN